MEIHRLRQEQIGIHFFFVGLYTSVFTNWIKGIRKIDSVTNLFSLPYYMTKLFEGP